VLDGIKLFTGNANPELAQSICKYLDINLGRATVKTFSDGEIMVEIGENVRGKDIYVLQSACHPVNDHLMELLIMIDALKRASAARINVVFPYYCYSRQDRKVAPRVPISAKMVADLISVAGAHRLISLDLHANQIQGFFDIPVDNIFAAPVMLDYMKEDFKEDLDKGHFVIVSPDAGGVERARAFAKRLACGLAIVVKRGTEDSDKNAWELIGEVKGMSCMILDDMVDTGKTLLRAVNALHEAGAAKINACCTHGVLSGDSVEQIEKSNLESLIITDSVPLREKKNRTTKIEVLSVAPLLGETIKRVYHHDSVSSLFV